MKQAQMRERLLKKVQEKQATATATAAAAAAVSGATTAVFTSGDKPAKTPRVQGQAPASAPPTLSSSAAPASIQVPKTDKQKSD